MKNVTSKNSAPLWVPSGFERYKIYYPSTPAMTLPDSNYTQNFIKIWYELKEIGINPNNSQFKQLFAELQNTTFVLIRGFLGNYMPGNLVQICKALQSLGLQAFIAHNSARSTIAENAKHIVAEIRHFVDPGRRLLFLGHSKGGLEAQWIITIDGFMCMVGASVT